METLADEFNTALSLIGLGDKRTAGDGRPRTKVRPVLEADDDLVASTASTPS